MGTRGMGTLGAADTGGTSGHVALRNLWALGVAQGHAWGAVGWQGLCGDGHCPSRWEPTLSPRQVKRSLQGTAAHETPIAFTELEGTCRTSYGYPQNAGTARAPPAALAPALALLALLLSVPW